jgi:hypothetical protein
VMLLVGCWIWCMLAVLVSMLDQRERNSNNHDKYEQKYCSSSTHRTLYSGIVLGAMGNKTDQSSICCWIPKRASRSNSRFLDNIWRGLPHHVVAHVSSF